MALRLILLAAVALCRVVPLVLDMLLVMPDGSVVILMPSFGELVGAEVGAVLGAAVGDWVDAAVGFDVAKAARPLVGADVGEIIGDALQLLHRVREDLRGRQVACPG